MAFTNLSFETEDAAALGLADSWTVSITSAGIRYAGFEDGSAAAAGNVPYESFEGGFDSNEDYVFYFLWPFDPLILEAAAYDSISTEYYEDFEEEWNTNQSYMWDWGDVSSSPDSFDTSTPEDFEDFEEEWNTNEDYMWDWADVVAGPGEDSATFDAESKEDFEDHWDVNHEYFFDFATWIYGFGNAQFDGEYYEDFEECKEPFLVIFNPSTNILEKASHGLSNGQNVRITTIGTLPSGVRTGTYFVINANTNDFQISVTSGGSAVTFTDAGVGDHTATPDQAVYWTTYMETL